MDPINFGESPIMIAENDGGSSVSTVVAAAINDAAMQLGSRISAMQNASINQPDIIQIQVFGQ